jgi:hypothetical protein
VPLKLEGHYPSLLWREGRCPAQLETLPCIKSNEFIGTKFSGPRAPIVPTRNFELLKNVDVYASIVNEDNIGGV